MITAAVVTGALVIVAIALGVRRTEPARRRLADVDPDGLAATMVRQLDDADWELRAERDGVTVYSASDLDCPFVGFRTVTMLDGVAPEDVVAFLSDGLLDAFETMNARYVDGQELKREDERGIRVVRTAFDLPAPLADREFVHALFTRQLDDATWVVGYLSVDDADLPPPADGFVRCPIYPSGQRITALPDGRVRVEHLMVYDLAGAIAPRVQNTLFLSGHVDAYVDEWRHLGERLGARQIPFAEAA